MALKWHREAVWRRAGDPDIFGSGTTYRIFGPGIGKNSPALDISPTNPGGYELWVWSGPAEKSPVLGLMGADLRGQKRAQRLGWYRLLREAKEAAEAIHATGVFRSRSDNPTMAISGSDWYDSFDIEWAHKDLGSRGEEILRT